MQRTRNPSKVGILATLLTVSTLATLSQVHSKFLFERLSLTQNKAAKNPVLVSDSFEFVQKDTPLLQQYINSTSTNQTTVNLTAVTYNLAWLNTQIVNATDEIINNTNPRLQTSIRLDKDVYLPNDVVFAEVLVLNALNKTPAANSSAVSSIQQYYNLTIQILDTGNNVIYSANVVPTTFTATIAFKLNSSLSLLTGDYVVRVFNSFVPVVQTTFHYQALNNDPAVVNIQLPQPSYNLGDTVRAVASVLQPDGTTLNPAWTVLYNVSFGNSSVANTSLPLSSTGLAILSFAVPQTASVTKASIIFTIKNGNATVYVYSFVLSINNPGLMVVDFWPGSGYITQNVACNIFYQAWTNASRTEPIDFKNASLKQQTNATYLATLVNQGLSSTRGKGVFEWTPINTTGSQPAYVELTINGQVLRRTVAVNISAFQTTNQSEVHLKLINANRFVGNNEALQFQILNNGSVNASETYIAQIRNGEVILWQDQYNLIPYVTKNVTVNAANFPLVTGGILSLSLFKVNRNLEVFYRSRVTTTTTTTTTTPAATTAAPTTKGTGTTSAPTTKAGTGTTAAPTTTKAGTGTTVAPTTTKAGSTTKAGTGTTVAPTTTKAGSTTKAGTGTTVAPTTTKVGAGTTVAPTTTKAGQTTTAAPTTKAGVTTTAAPTTKSGATTTAAPTTKSGATTTAAPTTKANTATTVAPTTTKAGTGTTVAPTTTKAGSTTKAGTGTTAAPTTTKAGTGTTAAPTTTKAGTGTTAAPTTTKAATTMAATTKSTVTTPAPTTTVPTTTTPATTTTKAIVNNATFLNYLPPDYTLPNQTAQFLDPKGEFLFYKRAADNLNFTVTLDKAVPYLPGDTVQYTVTIVNTTTGKPITQDAYVTLSVVDQNAILNGGLQSTQTILYRQALLGQIKNADSELVYSQGLLSSILAGQASDISYLRLVLAVQGWRNGAFNVPSLLNSANLTKNLSAQDQSALNQLYKSVVLAQQNPATSVVKAPGVKTGSQGKDASSADYTGNVANARAYSHALRAGWLAGSRLDKTSTVAFTSAGLAKSGVLKGSLVLNDMTTTYSFMVDGFTATGVLGSANSVIMTRDYISISYTLPKFLVVGDTLKVPVQVANQGNAAVTLNLYNLINDPSITVTWVAASKATLSANSAVASAIYIKANFEKVGAQISIFANASVGTGLVTSQQDGVINVVPRDYVYRQQTKGGLIGSSKVVNTTSGNLATTINVPVDANSSSQIYSLNVYPTILSFLESSRKALVSGPQNDFEQLTATIYPLINRLQILRNQTLTADLLVQINSLSQNLQAQYNSLVRNFVLTDAAGLKVDGQDLSTEAMTAYALIFFSDYAVNNSFVDNNLLAGLQAYLNSRRNGMNGFYQSFSSYNGIQTPQYVHDAYVVYALSYVNTAYNLANEVTALKANADAQIASAKNDTYFQALLANILYKLKRSTEAQTYADVLVKAQSVVDGSLALGVATSTFNGGSGLELQLQTTSMAILAWNNNLAKYTSAVTAATGFLFNNNLNSMIGDSQSTTLAHKVAIAYYANLQSVNGNATLQLLINGVQVATAPLSALTTDTISFPIQTYLRNNANLIQGGSVLNIALNVLNAQLVAGATRDFRMVYTLSSGSLLNTSYVPPPPTNVTQDFSVTLTVGKTPIGLEAQNGKSFNYTITIRNIMVPGQNSSGPVNVAIGHPSCIDLDQVFANTLINTNQIVGWEIVDNGITVLLLKSLLPGELRTLTVQYVQKYSGTCSLRDNLAYQTNGDVQLVRGTKIA